MCVHVHVHFSFREIFDSKVKEYQEAQKVKKEKEINELVERYVTGVLVITKCAVW